MSSPSSPPPATNTAPPHRCSPTTAPSTPPATEAAPPHSKPNSPPWASTTNTTAPTAPSAAAPPPTPTPARLKATPNTNPTSRYRTRHDTIDNNGRVSLRYRGRLHHIGIGRPHARTKILMLIAERDIRIINPATGELLRHLTLDPTRDYQPQNAKED